MLGSISSILGVVLKLGALGLVFNEVRGIILAAPVLYGMYQAGGTWTAIWLGVSSLGGIALSVIVPIFAAQRLKKHVRNRNRLTFPVT